MIKYRKNKRTPLYSLEIWHSQKRGSQWWIKSKEEESNLRNLLNIPTHYKIVFNAVIGYAEKDYIQPKRKSLQDTIQII